jgi:hypothetical protein
LLWATDCTVSRATRPIAVPIRSPTSFAMVPPVSRSRRSGYQGGDLT